VIFVTEFQCKSLLFLQATLKLLMFVMYQSNVPITARDWALELFRKGEDICSHENIIFWSKDQVLFLTILYISGELSRCK
jgi:hypothetical protein